MRAPGRAGSCTGGLAGTRRGTHRLRTGPGRIAESWGSMPVARRTIRRVLAAEPDAVGKARRSVIGLPVDQATRDVLSLLVSELVTNAIRHAGLTPEDPI